VQHHFLLDTAIYLASAVVAVPLFKRFGLGAVLGYLAAGSVIGPWGLRLVHDPERTLEFAELGVVLLLFLIGLELKPSRLWHMRYAVFGLGGAQVGLSTALLGAVAWWMGCSLTAAVIVGFTLSLSSTAFALQILTERGQLNTAFGRSTFAILLFQDLIAIPVLALLPSLGVTAEGASTFSLVGFARMAGTIAAVIFGGRFAIRPLLAIVSSADSREVFSAAALLLVLGVAMLMQSIGLSMALGAFLAGVLLSDSEYRHLLEADIEPFKGILLGLFFISVGTSVDYGLVVQKSDLILFCIASLVLIKYGAVYAVGRWANLTSQSARQMASVLPQGGEFAFVLFGVAIGARLLTQEQVNILVVVVIGSMVATPLIGLIDRLVFSRFFVPSESPYDSITNEQNPVIVAGFGRVGQMIARILRLQNIGFTTLEKSSEQVRAVRKFGAKVYYGDASRLDLLEAAGARSAKYFVLAIDEIETSVKTAVLVRKHFPHLIIFARARNRQHVFELKEAGVTHVWRETFASSLEMANGLLLEMGTPETVAQTIVQKFRTHDEQTLLKQYEIHDDEKAIIQYSKQSVQQLLDSVAADRQQGKI
jgi:glutathione-regulated potassium-efflux system ancillary protein KefC